MGLWYVDEAKTDSFKNLKQKMEHVILFNRPGVAGAVLQKPLFLIEWLNNLVIHCENIFKTLS